MLSGFASLHFLEFASLVFSCAIPGPLITTARKEEGWRFGLDLVFKY